MFPLYLISVAAYAAVIILAVKVIGQCINALFNED